MKTLVIDRARLKHNIAVVRSRAGSSVIYGVLKGNAYGMGLVEVASILRDEGIRRFAVTEVTDAVRLRKGGFTDEEILLVRSTSDPHEIETILDHNVIATIGSYDAAVALGGIAESRSTVAEAHIKIDTGMGRYGFLPEETDKIKSVYRYLPTVAITGVYTHFHSAFAKEKSVREQCARFDAVLAYLRGEGLETGVVHAANSSALMRYGFSNYDAVRVGSAFTGRMPGKRAKFNLQSVGHIECAIAELRWLPRDHPVGYGGAYKTRRPTRVAVLPVGYDDGFCVEKSRDIFRLRDVVRYIFSDFKRLFSKRRMYVRINGARARVLGHVGMAHTVVDVTDITCSTGDIAVLECSPSFCGRLPRKYV